MISNVFDLKITLIATNGSNHWYIFLSNAVQRQRAGQWIIERSWPNVGYWWFIFLTTLITTNDSVEIRKINEYVRRMSTDESYFSFSAAIPPMDRNINQRSVILSHSLTPMFHRIGHAQCKGRSQWNTIILVTYVGMSPWTLHLLEVII